MGCSGTTILRLSSLETLLLGANSTMVRSLAISDGRYNTAQPAKLQVIGSPSDGSYRLVQLAAISFAVESSPTKSAMARPSQH